MPPIPTTGAITCVKVATETRGVLDAAIELLDYIFHVRAVAHYGKVLNPGAFGKPTVASVGPVCGRGMQ
jgi:hypothetical protein